MSDGDARLAARLARQAGLYHPKDWVKVYESHTPYEWLIQVALSKVDPWGDDRDDERAARMTANFILSQMSSENAPDYQTLVDGLKNYLPIHQPDEEV
ncbi:MAG: hypothetical protein WCH39_01665 [Schlesneria sp.]